MIRLEIVTRDRVGITVEILEKINDRKINLVSMEVFTNRVCVKIENISSEVKEVLKKELCEIKDVISINEVELLYYEQNEKRLLAVINSVDEGIISIDKNFNITIFNNYCEELFNFKKDEVIGEDIRKVIGEKANIVDLIKSGQEYDNLEFTLRTNKGDINYLSSGRTIKNDNNETVGGVVSIKDFNKARELVNIISGTEEGAFKDIIGGSESIEKVKKMAAAIAKSNSTVLLRGDSGTGKELFAKAIHALSDRKNESFVAINCAALPEGLLESELFGYEKGSFTGAMLSGREGLFKEANDGTLFLDEIGELSMLLQAKLLRVLQEGRMRKIGSNKEEFVDVRIIAATNKNLENMIVSGRFREDLYYRLNVIPMYIPKLKERLEDIPALVQFFIQRLNKRLKKNIKGAQLDFISALMQYDWPGNIRELQNVVERAMNLCPSDYLSSKELIIDIANKDENPVPSIINAVKVQQLPLKEELERCEEEIIRKVLNDHASCRKAAKLLKVSHTTIMNKIKKYNIEV